MKNFKCTRCGECCRAPRLSKKDISRIKAKDFIYTDALGNKYIKDKDGWCMFLKKGKTATCTIYDKRPKICRQYPSRLVNGSCKPEKLKFDSWLERR